ncbi:MAG: hypothetical protein H7141_04705 [Burkholderiales bacterium]|nr:hypothetical protein [Bacteroidia bacterium]
MRNLIIVIFISLVWQSAFAQLSQADLKYYSELEDSLKHISEKVFFSKKESSRFEANRKLIALWNDVLKNENSISYPFDSLKNDISLLMAPDKKFRIITWNIIKDDQTHAFFGFIQVNNSKTIKKSLFKKETTSHYEVFPLADKSASVKTPENYVGDPAKWFGMLYVDVIKSDEEFYTLIAWDGNDKLTQRKFIDILYFKPDGTPVFGKDVFKFPGKFAKRIMFEYASEVAMSLKYNPARKQIIFSHLAPNNLDPAMEGQFQYYGPDGSFDALLMKKGKWIYEPAIDIRKNKDKTDNIKKPEPNKQTPVYKPK